MKYWYYKFSGYDKDGDKYYGMAIYQGSFSSLIKYIRGKNEHASVEFSQEITEEDYNELKDIITARPYFRY